MLQRAGGCLVSPFPTPPRLLSAQHPCPTPTGGTVSSASLPGFPADLKSCDGPRLQVRLDVARVQVGDTHQKARPGESPELAEAEARVL